MQRMQTRWFTLIRKTSFRFQGVTSICLALFSSQSVHAGPYPGPLEQTVIETYRLGNYLDSCDVTLAQKNLRLGLARVLDDREVEITDYLRAIGRGGRMGYDSSELNIGPLTLIPRLESTPEKKSENGGWVSKLSGWEDFDHEYQTIRGTRIGAAWARLRDVVRATISDDYRRGVNGVWMRVNHQGVSEAPNLFKLVKACLDEKKCDDLQKNDSFRNALNLTPNAASDFGNFRKATTDAGRERALKNLLGEVKRFVNYFEPVKQRGVRVADPHTLIISLDAGEFRGYETDLGLLVERFWKLGDNSLKVEWMTSTREEPLFRFLFLPTPKSGSQIDYIRRTITIGQGAVESIPAHQIGRALGFRARYFSVWQPDKCKYEDQSKPEDLLSDGRKGSVATEHWESLLKAYTETSATTSTARQ